MEKDGHSVDPLHRCVRWGSLEEEALVARCGQLPGLQEGGVGPLLGCQKAAGLLLLALLAKAGKVCRHLLGVRAGHRLLQVIQGLGDRGETSGPAQSEEGRSDRAGPWWDPSAWDLGLGGSPVGPVPAGAASTPVLLGALTGLERPQRASERDRGLAISVSLTRSRMHRSTDMKHSSPGRQCRKSPSETIQQDHPAEVSQPSKITTNNKMAIVWGC